MCLSLLIHPTVFEKQTTAKLIFNFLKLFALDFNVSYAYTIGSQCLAPTRVLYSLLHLICSERNTRRELTITMAKRQRPTPPIANDVLHQARQIWSRDPGKARSPQTEDTDFLEFFGCGVLVFCGHLCS